MVGTGASQVLANEHNTKNAKNPNNLELTNDAKCEGERHREWQGANLKSQHLAKPRYKVQSKLKYLAAESWVHHLIS